MPGHALNGGAGEQIGGVVKADVHPRLQLLHHQHQIVFRNRVLDLAVLHRHAGERQGSRPIVQQVEHHLEKRAVGERTLGLKVLDQHLKGHGLVLKGSKRRLAYPCQQGAEARVARQVGTQHKRVEKESNQGFDFSQRAIGNGRADQNVSLTRVAGEEDAKRCL